MSDVSELQKLTDKQLAERLKKLQAETKKHLAEYHRRKGEKSGIIKKKQ